MEIIGRIADYEKRLANESKKSEDVAEKPVKKSRKTKVEDKE